MNDLEDLFSQLDLERGDRVQEAKQVIYDQLAEVKEPWLVQGLYEHYVSFESPSGRSPCLELILSVRDPHDKFLCEHLSEILSKGTRDQKNAALIVLGQLIRKSPSWLHKITSAQMPLLRDLLRLLKTEEDVPVLISALLDLITLLPAIPSYITPYLQELFELFSHLAAWRSANITSLNPVHQFHLQSILLSYFHRLYGMFPCNFLHYLRNNYANQASLFRSSIQPMLVTVRLHPLLVSHSRDQERSNARWKKMELHDVLTESSRYALIPQEFNNEDILEETASLLLPEPLHSTVPAHVSPLDESWVASNAESTETAIEATPETTPFVTPSKEDSSLRRSSGNPSRSLRLDLSNVRSPVSLVTSPSPSSGGGPRSAPLAPTSPYGEGRPYLESVGGPWTASPSGWDGDSRRRDSIFDKPPGESASLAKLNKLNQERKLSPMKLASPGDSTRVGPGIPSSPLEDEVLKKDEDNQSPFGAPEHNMEEGQLDYIKSAHVQLEKEDPLTSYSPSFPSRPASTLEWKLENRSRYISFCDENIGIMDLGSCANDFGTSLTEKRRKRYHSCPDPSKLMQMNYESIYESSSFRNSLGEDEHTLTREEAEASTQTEVDGMCFAYEHLFPVVGLLERGAHFDKREVENPHLLLDKYLDSICNSTMKENKEETYKSIIVSLKSQLLYERNRREILGERNRRLLGKSKSSRILKEENTALKDQLQLVKSEIDDLHRQIEEIRREKHLVEEERSSTARNRDHEIEIRSAEIRSLKINAQKSDELIDELQLSLEQKRRELDISRAQFFSVKAEYEVLEQKESERMKTEIELVQLREKVHKMGELRHKYLEQLEHPGHNMESEKMHIFKQAYEKDLQTMSRAVENKNFEMETFKSRILELESFLSKKEAQILDLKKLIRRMQDEHEEVRREYKATYESMVQLHLQTESHTLEVRDQLAQNTRVLNNNATVVVNSSLINAKKVIRQPGGLLDFHATRNVDIEQPEPAAFGAADRSFVVGSPPLSSGGSIASDKSEVMRRALKSTRPIKFDEGGPSEDDGNPPRPPLVARGKDGFKSSLNNGNIS